MQIALDSVGQPYLQGRYDCCFVGRADRNFNLLHRAMRARLATLTALTLTPVGCPVCDHMSTMRVALASVIAATVGFVDDDVQLKIDDRSPAMVQLNVGTDELTTVRRDFVSISYDASFMRRRQEGRPLFNISNPRLHKLLRELRPCIIRIGGTAGDHWPRWMTSRELVCACACECAAAGGHVHAATAHACCASCTARGVPCAVEQLNSNTCQLESCTRGRLTAGRGRPVESF